MKKISEVLTGILLMVIHLSAFSQPLPGAGVEVIAPYQLDITYFKTTNLIFPYAITCVDRGSKDVLAQKARGIENVLQIKAGRKGFEETNLTVITADGKLYSYVLNYSDRPQVLNLQFKEKSRSSDILFSHDAFDEAELKKSSEKIALAKRSVFGKMDKRNGIRLQLEGLYVKGRVMYCQISLLNKTNFDYDLDQLRFFVRDRKETKRTASQEREIIPLFINNEPSTIKGRSEQMFVIALPKFTIPDQKYFAVQVMEKNGGRHLELKIGNPTIIKSKTITPYPMSQNKKEGVREGIDPDANTLLSIYNEDFTEALIEGTSRNNFISNTINSKAMNQKNFDYLKDQIKFTGFGEGLENQLKEKMQHQAEGFTLSHQAKFGNDTVDATLQFRKSNQSDMYFFNSYQVNLKKENSADNTQQVFYINKGNNVTLKEAFNLMSGRAVNKELTNKEGQLYNAWIQMDFKQTEKNGNYKLKQFHQNYGYDLDKELGKHPIKELNNDEYKKRLIESLEKGNRQSVSFSRDGVEQKQFIEANPRFKTINIYDGNMQRLASRQAKGEKQEQGENNTAKQNTKKESLSADDAGPDMPKAARKTRKKKSQSVS